VRDSVCCGCVWVCVVWGVCSALILYFHPGENRSQVLARGAKRLIGNSAGKKKTPARISKKKAVVNKNSPKKAARSGGRKMA